MPIEFEATHCRLHNSLNCIFDSHKLKLTYGLCFSRKKLWDICQEIRWKYSISQPKIFDFVIPVSKYLTKYVCIVYQICSTCQHLAIYILAVALVRLKISEFVLKFCYLFALHYNPFVRNMWFYNLEFKKLIRAHC